MVCLLLFAAFFKVLSNSVFCYFLVWPSAIKVQFLPNAEQPGGGTNAMKVLLFSYVDLTRSLLNSAFLSFFRSSQAIYGKSSSKAFMSETFVPVNFHSKTPTFHEEIKIALPLNLTKSHNILFTFIHVSCTAKKGKEEEVCFLFSLFFSSPPLPLSFSSFLTTFFLSWPHSVGSRTCLAPRVRQQHRGQPGAFPPDRHRA